MAICLGAGPFPNVLDFTVTSSDGIISTRSTADARLAYMAQFFSEPQSLRLDLLDDQVSEVVASVRTVRFEREDMEPFEIGHVVIGSNAPVAIRCNGP